MFSTVLNGCLVTPSQEESQAGTGVSATLPNPSPYGGLVRRRLLRCHEPTPVPGAYGRNERSSCLCFSHLGVSFLRVSLLVGVEGNQKEP